MVKERDSMLSRWMMPWIPWALLGLFPLTIMGFYPSYFSGVQSPWHIHLHASLMGLWLITAVLQPWLIRGGKFHIHRWVGKWSYLLMPALMASTYLLLRFAYNRVLQGDEIVPPDYYPENVTRMSKAADFVVIGAVYGAWLFLYYMLGLYFRKRAAVHGTFMLAATLTVLGPAGDRFIGQVCDALGWSYNAVAENFIFAMVLLIFIRLYIYQRSLSQPVWPVITVLSMHATGWVLYYRMSLHPWWDHLAALCFGP